MRLPEFVDAVRSYGVKMSFSKVGGNQFYDDLLILKPSQSGVPRHYQTWHVRRLVAWLTIGAITGTESAYQAAQRRQAMRLLAAATEGYVVMSRGRAWWSLAPPVHAIRDMALVFPAIQWRPEHRPR